MTTFRAPSPPYVGPAAHDSGDGNKPIRRIVLHETQSDCERGGARANARWFRNPASRGSAHYIVDPGEVVQVVLDDTIAWHAPPNQHSIGIELCGHSSSTDLERWDTPARRAMMVLAAELVADLCLAYNVPPYYRGALALRLGRRGVTTHAQVAKAWKQSTHWDIGVWRRWRFMRDVRRRVARKRKAARS